MVVATVSLRCIAAAAAAAAGLELALAVQEALESLAGSPLLMHLPHPVLAVAESAVRL